jgi:hypothetical protein
MAITYTWKVSNLDTIPTKTIDGAAYTDLVKTVHWRLHGTDGTNEAEVYGSVELDTSAIDSGSFVQFANITGDNLATWAVAAMNAGGEGSVDTHKANIAARIAELVNPPVVSKMPAGITLEIADSEVVV